MDIVEQLQNAKKYSVWDEELYIDAADEIERLRNDKKDLLTQVQMLRQSMDWCKSLIFGIEQRLTIND
jgi:hypothetical protein